MPKRKYKDQDFDKLMKKIRRIEEEIHRSKKKRVRVLESSDSDSDSASSRSEARDSPERQSEPNDCPPTDPEVVSDPSTSTKPNSEEQTANGEGTAPAPPPAEENMEPELDTEILEILGIDPSKSVTYGKEIQKDLAVRFEHITTKGLTKEDRKELSEKYRVPSNCKLVDAPVLNPETKAALSEMVIKRDKSIESKQKLMAAAISSLGQAISLILSSKDKNTDLLRLLMDTGRTLCDCQHNDTITRRNFIIFSVKKEMKESLQNAKIDNFLFGQDLNDTLKTARAINKSGAELKPPPAPKPSTSKKNLPASSKNWKSSNPTRKQPIATPKAKETASTSITTRSRTSSSKPSSSQRSRR